MPRISHASIEAHVKVQTARIIKAARKLFASRGFANVDLGEIADAIELKRNSLYRYFPSKEDVLFACLREGIDGLKRDAEVILAGPGSAFDRLITWFDFMIDAGDAGHRQTILLLDEVTGGSPELRGRVAKEMRILTARIKEPVEELLKGQRRDCDMVVGMISAMVHYAATHAYRTGRPGLAKIELRAFAMALLLRKI